MEDLLRVGVISSAHGIKGEVNVFPTTDEPEMFAHWKTLRLVEKKQSRLIHVRGAKYFKNMVILSLEEIADRNQAELLRQAELYINEAMDLMLGQHVIMEEDTGETEEKTGLWIPNYYVVSDDETNTYYVWSCDDNQKVCKKEISVGEIDEEMLEYQILDGLTENDYIAFPDELTQEGMEAILPDSMENGENQGDAGNAGAMNVME